MSAPATTQLVLDAHVHLYECFDLQRLLDSARSNYEKVLVHHGFAAASTGFCLLCVDLQDRALEDSLGRLACVADYQIDPVNTDEPHSRHILHKPSGMQWQIVWGHQIICAENLEVLAFGLPSLIPNGTAIDDVLKALQGEAFGILPWGFGKWSGGRGKIVSQLLERSAEDYQGRAARWWVGDNGGRLALSDMPSQITRAMELGRWNIPGSEPLPFPNQVNKVGSHGVVLQGAYDQQAPLASVRRLLGAAVTQPEVFGTGERLTRFVLSQFGMQWRKRVKS